MKQYFSVGEEVVLCSKSYPEYNGEYIVYKVLVAGDRFICRISGLSFRNRDGVGYLLDIPLRDLEYDLPVETLWDQTALKKKHKSAGQSFSEIINSTKTVKS